MNQSDLKHLILITIIFIAACIETDIYLPAFTDMMDFFSASEKQIQSLLTWNFLGICLSGPFYGPISDSIGRKTPLLVALGVFLVGSMITTITSSFTWMLWGRLLQGLGSGGCFTLGTAIIFDTFQANKAIKAINQLNLTIPCIMSLAPMAGGYLNHIYGFRANFLTITIFVLISLLICCFSLKETLPPAKRQPLLLKKVLIDFKRAFISLPFLQLTLVISLLFSGYMVFLSGSAVIFITELGVKKELFPFYQAAILVAWLIASVSANRILDKIGTTKLKQIGTVLILIGAAGFAGAGWLCPQDPLIITAVMLFYTFGVNWVMAIYFPEGMEVLPEIKGVTASLLTSARLLISAAILAVVSKLYNATVYPMVIALVLITCVTFPIILFYENQRKRSQRTIQ
jgi:MFS transporter, DHA1 family, multidrug resistance protein